MSEDFKKLFYDTMHTNIPAHLAVDYYWLGFEELKEFEFCYERWLDEKRKETVMPAALDTASYIIAHLLQFYKTPRNDIRNAIEIAKMD